MKIVTAAIALALFAAGCSSGNNALPPTPAETAKQAGRDYERRTSSHELKPRVLDEGRFRVERVQTFDDGSAYGSARSVYVITDTKTGQEFVGISGVGISELGSHRVGKTNYSDER